MELYWERLRNMSKRSFPENPEIFWEKVLNIERRISRLEVIYYVQLILWVATLLKLLFS